MLSILNISTNSNTRKILKKPKKKKSQELNWEREREKNRRKQRKFKEPVKKEDIGRVLSLNSHWNESNQWEEMEFVIDFIGAKMKKKYVYIYKEWELVEREMRGERDREREGGKNNKSYHRRSMKDTRRTLQWELKKKEKIFFFKKRRIETKIYTSIYNATMCGGYRWLSHREWWLREEL